MDTGEVTDVVVRERHVEVDGDTWRVVLMGQASGGRVHGVATPLLLLGFVPPDGEAPDRECMVAGQTLEGLSDAEVERAWRNARPPPPPGGRGELFPGTATRGTRGR